MQYYLLCRNLMHYEMVSMDTNPYDIISSHPNADWYMSVYQFNEQHKALYESVLSDYQQNPEKYNNKKPSGIAGLTGATTNFLVFDFDSKDIELARKDTVSVVDKLLLNGIPKASMQICYSGSKGFSLIIETSSTFNSTQAKTIAKELANGCSTWDPKIYNDVRVLRLPLTRHQKTGHYKIPLSIEQLRSSTVPEIQEAATNAQLIGQLGIEDLLMEQCDVPQSILALSNKTTNTRAERVRQETTLETDDIDWSLKPKWLSNCKYAIFKGFFEEGTRDQFFSIMAATFKSQFPDDQGMVYRMLKTVAENQAKRNRCDRYPDAELWVKAQQVFKPGWQGGTYSCKNNDDLHEYCAGLVEHKCHETTDDKAAYDISEVKRFFRKYASEIDQNTIKTGIQAIDDYTRVTIGMHVGILAAPGAGKTTMILSILKNTSLAGIKSMFFSMDMYGPLIYQKQIQNLTGLQDNEIFEMIKTNDPKLDAIDAELEEIYKNVKFVFKSGLTVDEIREMTLDYQNSSGEKVTLVATDYAECIAGPFSDGFANSKVIAHKLKDLASQDNLCVITLVQPPKAAGDASVPLTSMRQVKGPSDWEQGFSLILGLYREGYNTLSSVQDRFITINSLKNRMGGSFSVDCAWNGQRGTIEELDALGHEEIKRLRQNKSEMQDQRQLFRPQMPPQRPMGAPLFAPPMDVPEETPPLMEDVEPVIYEERKHFPIIRDGGADRKLT